MKTMSKPTVASVKKLIAGRWPKAVLRVNEKVLTPAAKAKIREEQVERKAELERIEAELPGLTDADTKLREVARFCVDVDGEPSVLAQLRAAVERAERRAELIKRRRDLSSAQRKASGMLLGNRYEAVESESWFSLVHASGDTLEELAERIGRQRT